MLGGLGGWAVLLVGCNPYAEGLKQTRAEERERNRTLTLAALVMEGVKSWSAAHGGALPNEHQFHDEVQPPPPPKNDWNFTNADLKEAQRDFTWSFAGGRPASPNLRVGRLSGPTGATVAYSSLEVTREDLIPVAER